MRPVEKPVVSPWYRTPGGILATPVAPAAPCAAAPPPAAAAAIWLVTLFATNVQAIVPIAARPIEPPTC